MANFTSKTNAGDATRRVPPPAPGLKFLYRTREPFDDERLVRLNRNERQAPLPQWFMENLKQSLHSGILTNYPITDGLYKELSSWVGVPEDQLLLTAGSDAAIKAVYQAYVRPGDAVVMFEPSYAMYEVYAQMFQARGQKVPFNENLELDAGRLLGSVVPDVRLVMISNPNQPTATLLREDIILALAERTGSVGALLAIDEAYYPFSQTTVLSWIKQFPHLLVLRSLSKAAGLAGLRVGFAAGHREVIDNLYKVRSVHDINSVAVLVLREIIKHPQVIDDYVAEVAAGRRVLVERAEALGLVPLPTSANFLLLRVGHRCQPARLVDSLRLRGYIVKGPFTTPCLADCIRVTLGPPALMGAFADALEQVLSDVVK